MKKFSAVVAISYSLWGIILWFWAPMLAGWYEGVGSAKVQSEGLRPFLSFIYGLPPLAWPVVGFACTVLIMFAVKTTKSSGPAWLALLLFLASIVGWVRLAAIATGRQSP